MSDHEPPVPDVEIPDDTSEIYYDYGLRTFVACAPDRPIPFE